MIHLYFLFFIIVFSLHGFSQPLDFVHNQLILSTNPPSDSYSRAQSFSSTQSILLPVGVLQQLPVQHIKNLKPFNGPHLGIQSIQGRKQMLLVTFSDGAPLDQYIAVLESDPSIHFAKKNYIIPVFPVHVQTAPSSQSMAFIQSITNDPDFQNSYVQSYLNRINLFTAWDVQLASSSLVAAVIDTGARTTHEDLSGRLITQFSNHNLNVGDNNNNINDLNGHGTHVSGIIGAIGNNSKGIAGVAYGCQLLSIKTTASDSDVFIESDIISALNLIIQYHSVHQNIAVINMSLGGSFPEGEDEPAFFDSITEAVNDGICVVVAAGNVDRKNNGSAEDIDAIGYWPAIHPSVITVSGSTSAGIYDHTNFFYGNSVDLIAPGIGIRSTYNTADNSYVDLNGTSMASPIVAGAVCLLKSKNSSLTPAQIRQALTLSAVDYGTPATQYIGKYGAGTLNVLKALAYVWPAPPNATHTPYSSTTQVPLRVPIPLTVPLQEGYGHLPLAQLNLITLNYREVGYHTTFEQVTEFSIDANASSSGTATIYIPKPDIETTVIEYFFEVGNLGTSIGANSGERLPANGVFTASLADISPPKIVFENYGFYYSPQRPISVRFSDNVSVDPSSIIVKLSASTIPTETIGADQLTINSDSFSIPSALFDSFKNSSTLSVFVSIADTADSPNTTTQTKTFGQSDSLFIQGPQGLNSPVVNAPNPFNPDKEVTAFCLEVSQTCDVSIQIYSLHFQLIHQIHRFLPSGYHEIEWAGTNDMGNKLASGVYVFVIKAVSSQGQTAFKHGKIAIIR